jgi:hypothetical protein
MKLTNKTNLPAPLVRAIESHEHRGAFYSASALQKSPRQFWLAKRHDAELEADVSNCIWAMLGTAFHELASKSADKDCLSEDYLEIEIAGQMLSGSFDLYEFLIKKLDDYKTTSVWSIIYGSKLEEWTAQTNIYAHLLEAHGFPVEHISVFALLRDWQKSKAKDDLTYPQSQIKEIKLKVWDKESREHYIRNRIGIFELTREIADDSLPDCSPEERWEQPTTYAVKKEVNKKATRVYKVKEEVDAALVEYGKGHIIETRPGSWNRCADYCPAHVFCNQYKKYCEAQNENVL